MTVEELRTHKSYKLHHTASRKGYESRKTSGHVEPYSGKFGKGFILVTPRWDTTRFVNIEYYIAQFNK